MVKKSEWDICDISVVLLETCQRSFVFQTGMKQNKLKEWIWRNYRNEMGFLRNLTYGNYLHSVCAD